MKLCFAAIVVVSNVLLAHGALQLNGTALSEDEEKNIVDVLKITPDEDQMKAQSLQYIKKLAKVVGDGIEEIAKDLIPVKGPGSTTQSGAQGSSTSKPTAATTQPEEEKAGDQESAAPKNKRRKRAADKVAEGSTAASTKEELPALTTILVISSTIKKPEDFDFSEPIKFVVKTSNLEIIDGEKLKEKAKDIKSAIEQKAKTLFPDMKLTVSVVGQGLAAWAIVLIVIAVLLVVGAAGYFVVTYFRKQRGNSF